MPDKERTIQELNDEISKLRNHISELERERDLRLLDLKKPKTILIIDDEVELCNVIKEYVTARKPNYNIIMAHDGNKGEEMIIANPPDLLLLDINLPGKSGIKIFRDISEKNGGKKFPVLVFTVRGELEDFFDGIDADGFIHKPLKMDQVMTEIEKALSKKHKPIAFILDRESNPNIKELKEAIRHSGYKTMVMDGMGKFMAEAVQHVPDFILMDYEQQDILSGTSFVKKIREVQALLCGKFWPKDYSPVLIVYSFTSDGEKEKVIDAGADYYLGKVEHISRIVDDMAEIKRERERKEEERRVVESTKSKLEKLSHEAQDPATLNDYNYFKPFFDKNDKTTSK